MMKNFWMNNLKKSDRKLINTRHVGVKSGVVLQKKLGNATAYAWGYNSKRNAISAAHFRDYVKKYISSL